MAIRPGPSVPLGVFFLTLGVAGVYLIHIYTFLGNLALATLAEDGPLLLCKSGAVRSYYTGVYPVDYVLCILVAFFDAVLLDQTGRLFLIFFGSVFAPVVGLIYLEGAKWQNAGRLLSWAAMPFVLLAQFVGAGIYVPLWYSLFCFTSKPREDRFHLAAQFRAAQEMRAIFPAMGVGLIAPAMGLFFLRDIWPRVPRDLLHAVYAFWQPFPLWISAAAGISRLLIPTPPDVASAIRCSRRAFNRTLLVNGLNSMFMYYFTIIGCLRLSHATSKPFAEVVLSLFWVSLKPTSFAKLGHLVLIFDCLMVATSSIAFVTLAPGTRGSTPKKLFAVLLLSLPIGPGAAICWAWHRREQEMMKAAESELKKEF